MHRRRHGHRDLHRARLSLALLAALLLPASMAGGQPNSGGQPEIPADALVPNDEARDLFELLPSRNLTDAMIEEGVGAPGSETARPVDAIIEQTFAPGELVPGWQSSGVDLLPVIAALDGGLPGNIAEGIGRFGPSRVYLVDGPFETFVRPDWVLVGRRGAPFSADNVQVQVAHVSPKVIVAERIAYRRQGNAYCRERAESRLYADPAIAATEFDTIALFMTMRAMAALERRGLCEVVEEVGPGQHRTRLFDVEGHRLPALEGPETFRIVRRSATPRSQ